MTIPRVSGGEDCGEVQVLDILEEARKANLSRVVLIGCTEDGDVFRGSNFNELETVGMLFNAALLTCFEED
jgi:hypothetical protein